MARNRLSRQRLISAALELIDAEGPEKLTARKLASSLGASPMALYWHFDNKAQLLEGVGDYLVSLITPPVSLDQQGQKNPADWEETLTAVLHSVIDVVQQHPRAADLVVQRLLFTAPGQQLAEQALRALEQAGLDEATAVVVARHGLRVATTIGTERLFTGSPNSDNPGQEEPREVSFDQSVQPSLAASSDWLHRATPPELYRETAVNLFIAGVRALS